MKRAKRTLPAVPRPHFQAREPNARRASLHVLDAVLRRVMSVLLLYAVLAAVFVVMLALVSDYEPVTAAYLAGTPSDLTFLTPAEQSHMADVQLIVEHGLLLLLGCVLALTVYLQYHPLTRGLVRDSLILALLLAVLLIPFQWTFSKFHAVLFPQGNWQFPLDSWLITHFPPEFFIVIGVCWIGATVFFLGALARVLAKQQ